MDDTHNEFPKYCQQQRREGIKVSYRTQYNVISVYLKAYKTNYNIVRIEANAKVTGKSID